MSNSSSNSMEGSSSSASPSSSANGGPDEAAAGSISISADHNMDIDANADANANANDAHRHDHDDNNGDDGGGATLSPMMDLQRARAYVTKVKSILGPNSLQFHEFLNILLLYSRRELSPEEVIVRMSDLFTSHPSQQHRQQQQHQKHKNQHQDNAAPINVDHLNELILGFNEFLPPAYQIFNASSPAAAAAAVRQNIISSQSTKKRRRQRHHLHSHDDDDASQQQQQQQQQQNGENMNGKKMAVVTTINSIALPTTNTNTSTQSSHHPASTNNARIIIIAPTTQIILTPPKIIPWRDLLHNYYNPITQKVMLGRRRRRRRRYHFDNDDDDDEADDDDGDADINGTDYDHTNVSRKHQHQPQLQPQHLPVNCELCHGRRNSIAEVNSEPILLCERRGCNAEYHLGCLYQYRPFLFAKAKKEEEEKKEVDEHGGEVVEENGATTGIVGVDSSPSIAPPAAADSTMVDDDDFGIMYNTNSSTKMVIPPGEIYCAPCHSDGSTAVLEKYFDKVDYERSHFTCSRAYVVALLEEHMRQHPKGNVIVVDEDGAVVTGDNVDDGDNPNDPNGDDNKIWDDTAMLSRRRSQRLRRLLKNSPRSELWYPHELQAQIMLPNGDQGDECDEEIHKSKDGSMKNGDSEITDVTTSASFLVGKPIRLYNNLDNEYHVGRIVDWRKCTVYPRPTSLPPYEYIDAQTVRDEGSLMSPTHNQNDSKNNAAAVLNHISIDQLEYYGIGPLSTCEFLVRFPSGLQGRRKELLKWIMLEEHSLAVGMSLILGKKSKPSLSRSVDWKPAMILVRSALELVTVRSFLHEDDRGNLFATMTTERENTLAGDRWALASFFGEEQHDLLRLRDETCDLHDNPNLLLMDASGVNGKVKNEEGADRVEEADNDVQLLHPRDPPSSIDVPLALAMVEHCEQMRCKAWKKLLLRQPHHRYALVSSDEYSTQLHLEKDEYSYSTVSSKSKSDASIVKTTSNKSIRPLVERGLDRMWLAQLLLERAPPPPSVNSSPVPQQWSKDDLIHLQCERVLSVSQAMASLQR